MNNKRQARPPSSTSSNSKKSLTEDRNSISVDKNSLVNCSSSNVSVCNQQKSASKSAPDGEASQQATSSRLFFESDTNSRNIGNVSSKPTKEKKTRDRVSLRNFISRALFSNRGDAKETPRSSGSSTASAKKGRKSSTTSGKSSVNAGQVSTVNVMPVTPSVSSPPTLIAGSSASKRSSRCDCDEDHGDLEDHSTQKRCNICYTSFPSSSFPVLRMSAHCKHLACITCYRQYLCMQISESRVDLTCPECEAAIHPSDIKAILDDTVMLNKYEQFMIRRVLATDFDTRWCPAPDCGYAVIAAGCAECPRLVCEREECGTAFCYHCAGVWHPDSTCDEARAQRFGLSMATAAAVTFRRSAGNALFSAAPSSLLGKIKPCPRCKALIAKMDDGSCNHMTCTICGADFCWLCMKEISDLHFLSPTGCTFWGKKPWSRKKKLICQLGTLIGAPVGIALVAGVAIPSMIIGIPIWVGRKIARKMFFSKRYKRNLAVISGVTGAILVSPAVAALVIGFGVPLMLAYVYGVVPFSLCRNGGTCRSSNSANSVANSTSNLSGDDVIVTLPEDDPASGIHLRTSSMADSGSLDIATQQLRGSKTPDEQLMLRMMMVLDENDVVFNQNGSQVDTKSVSGTSARIRHRAEINHSNIDYQNASIGEFSMDSDAHSQKKLIMLDTSGQSIADMESSQQDRDSNIARIRLNDEERPNFDSASTIALNSSVRRQSISSESVNNSLGDRVTLGTISSDLDFTLATFNNRDYLDISEQDNASTKGLAGSILGARCLSLRMDTIPPSNPERCPASPVAITLDVSDSSAELSQSGPITS